MSMTEAVIQGIIQGLTEFLPVSSSGHLALYQYFTGNNSESGALFSLVLHLGTLLAVLIAFWSSILPLIIEFFSMVGDLFRGRLRLDTRREERRMIFLLIVSLLPLGLTFLLKDILQGTAADGNIVVEGVCFLVTSALLLLADSCPPGRIRAKQMSYRAAVAIGFAQAVAPLPGISRSGSTLSTGLILGLDRKYALDFSFIMGIPAVLGALLLDAKEILGGGLAIEPGVVAAGLATSLVFGLLAIGMVRWLVSSRKLRWFGFYTLVLGVVTLGIGICDVLFGHPVQAAVIAFFAK